MIAYCPDQSSINIINNIYPHIKYASSIFELLTEENLDEAVFATYTSISDNPVVVCLVLDALTKSKVKITIVQGERPADLDKYVDIFKWQAEFYAQLTSAKTKKKLNKLKAEKKRMGVIPWGFRVCTQTDTLVPDDYEQSVTRKILELKNDEHKSFYQITKILNESNYKKRNGNPWNDSNVKLIYDNYDNYKHIRDQ